MIRFVHHIAQTIKSKDVIAHRTRSAALHLVFVAEQALPGESTTIVQFTVREHTEQSGFTSVDISDNGNTREMLKTHDKYVRFMHYVDLRKQIFVTESP